MTKTRMPAGLENEIPLVPAVYGLHLFRFFRKKGISHQAILDGLNIDRTLFEQPDAHLSMRQLQPLLERAVELSVNPLIPFEFGLELDLQKHGLVGFSLLRGANFRELVATNVQYLRVRLPLMEINVKESRAGLTLTVEDMWPLGSAREFIAQIYMGSICTLGRLVTRQLNLCFDFPPPGPAASYEKRANCPVHFNQAGNSAFLPISSSSGASPGNRADLFVSQTADDGAGMDDDQEVVVQVRHLLLKKPGEHSSLEKVAGELDLSARSLRRRLHGAGFSFTELRNEIRRDLALRYLTGTRISVERIAARLGYSDQASFSKAFRSWTGQTPGQARREQRP